MSRAKSYFLSEAYAFTDDLHRLSPKEVANVPSHGIALSHAANVESRARPSCPPQGMFCNLGVLSQCVQTRAAQYCVRFGVVSESARKLVNSSEAYD